jgi:hypothetical protein
MTKKSHARLQRDMEKKQAELSAKALAKNTCYDDLNQIHAQCAAVLQGHVAIANLARDQELLAHVRDHKLLVHNIQALTQDLTAMNSELTEIRSQHLGKTGGSQDPDEVMGCITVYEQYALFLQRHDGVMMPTALHLAEQFDEANRDMQAAASKAPVTQADVNAAAAQDPSSDTVLDVVVKDKKVVVGDGVITIDGENGSVQVKASEGTIEIQAENAALTV